MAISAVVKREREGSLCPDAKRGRLETDVAEVAERSLALFPMDIPLLPGKYTLSVFEEAGTDFLGFHLLDGIRVVYTRLIIPTRSALVFQKSPLFPESEESRAHLSDVEITEHEGQLVHSSHFLAMFQQLSNPEYFIQPSPENAGLYLELCLEANANPFFTPAFAQEMLNAESTSEEMKIRFLEICLEHSEEEWNFLFSAFFRSECEKKSSGEVTRFFGMISEEMRLRLKEINVEGSRVTSENLALFQALERIHARDSKLDAVPKELTRLVRLDICRVSDFAIDSLKGRASLEELGISDTGIDAIPPGLIGLKNLDCPYNASFRGESLADCSSLEVLNLLNTQCEVIPPLKNLHTLDIRHNQRFNAACLEGLPALKRLLAQCARLSHIPKRMEFLEELDVSMLAFPEHFFRNTPNLKVLCAESSGIKYIPREIKELREIDISHVSRFSEKCLGNFGKVTTLKIQGSSIRKIAALMKSIQELYIRGNKHFDWSTLANVPNLKRLIASEIPFADAPLPPEIEYIEMDYRERMPWHRLLELKHLEKIRLYTVDKLITVPPLLFGKIELIT